MSRESLIVETIDQGHDNGAIVAFRKPLMYKAEILPCFVKIEASNVGYCVIHNDTVSFVESKIFIDAGENVVVKKYRLDLEDVIDEEGFYFLKDDFYIVGFYSTAWGCYEIYDYEGSTLGIQLIHDETGFFKSR